jgi:hypothetical protein
MIRRTIALAAILLSAEACRQESPDGADASAERSAPIEESTRVGPVSVSVTADRNELTYLETLTLRLRIDTAPGVVVEPPNLGEALSEKPFEYRIRDFSETSAVPIDDDTVRWEQKFDLEFFLSGEYELPGVTVGFTDERESASPPSESDTTPRTRREAVVPPIVVTVIPPSDGRMESEKLTEVPTLSTVELPAPPVRWGGWAAAICGLIVVAIALAMIVRRWKRAARMRMEPELPPHEWAECELQRLADENLPAAGRVKEYYYRLSGVIRIYIEKRFQLAAPEMTTEEFLTTVGRSAALHANHREALEPFLRSCDLVKFARYSPTPPEIDEAHASAVGFVEATSAAEEFVEPGVAQEPAGVA